MTIQMLKYQVFTEFTAYFIFFIIVLERGVDVDRGIVATRIVELLNVFVIFVIQPLFYLNGDCNFRNRVLHQGVWKALKLELFQTRYDE